MKLLVSRIKKVFVALSIYTVALNEPGCGDKSEPEPEPIFRCSDPESGCCPPNMNCI